ncbi:hypothetical protein [Kribbella sp. VKM Ac-2571]|uniref:hypothetical protein n=1 Tax=Kribbella sp. VKM Ac-2571 TaxID=2512222 RepID=UPI001EDFB67C|nr:hypothetical protein [Kribbella sp. VKM Ac-2571]
MTEQALDGRPVSAGIKEFAGEGTAAVVRAELLHLGQLGAAMHDPVQARRRLPLVRRSIRPALLTATITGPGASRAR